MLGDIKNNLAWKPGPGYWFAKGKVMKNVSVLTILGIVSCALLVWLSGCGVVAQVGQFSGDAAMAVLALGSEGSTFYAQPGETEAEGRRRHLRNARINQQNLIHDVDRALLFDQPSKLSSRRID